MCGICGISHPDSDYAATTVAAMNRALFHRGPDEAGSLDETGISLAMRRLAIIDLKSGQQPIFNEDESLALIFNGEIYNFAELRQDLEAKGHQFRTQSDTEVIIHLYEEEGTNMPRFLKGMFAFCIYDRRDGSLFLARDRFGEKPLFYHRSHRGEFAFSSEIRSLLECDLVPRRLNYEALGYYLRVGYVPAPLTLLDDVHVLPPGCWMHLEETGLRCESYFQIDYRQDPDLEDENVASEMLRSLLGAAVKRQAISDVPLGAFLSGGIDSSSVVAMLQSVSERPVKTFTMRFEGSRYDEGEVARQVAAALGTEHREFLVPNVSFDGDDLLRIVEHVGLPFVDSSAIPTYIISREIRRAVTVALSGDGGDELFAGYNHFHWAATIEKFRRLPNPLLDAGAALTSRLGRRRFVDRMKGLRRIQRGLAAASQPESMLPIALHTLFDRGEIFQLEPIDPVLPSATGELPRFTVLPPRAKEWSTLRRIMYFRLRHLLSERMLTKVDRMSMAASIEVRTPMLDPDLAEFSMRLPEKHLIRNGQGKFLLRHAMRDHLPEILFHQPKSGFDIPLHQYQNETYRQLACELLAPGGVADLFSQERVQKIRSRAISQQEDGARHSTYRASHQLWALMQLSAWQRRFQVSY